MRRRLFLLLWLFSVDGSYFSTQSPQLSAPFGKDDHSDFFEAGTEALDEEEELQTGHWVVTDYNPTEIIDYGTNSTLVTENVQNTSESDLVDVKTSNAEFTSFIKVMTPTPPDIDTIKYTDFSEYVTVQGSQEATRITPSNGDVIVTSGSQTVSQTDSIAKTGITIRPNIDLTDSQEQSAYDESTEQGPDYPNWCNGSECYCMNKLECTHCLECDDNHGRWFSPLQCTSNYCFCVYRDTGGVVAGTETLVGKPTCEKLMDIRPKCQRLWESTCSLVFSVGQLVRECNDSTSCDTNGFFKRERCTDEKCVCIDRDNGLVVSKEWEKGSHYCDNSSQPVYIPICHRQAHLSCTEKGLFADHQCIKNDCFCVYYDSGEEVFGTRGSIECETVSDHRGPCERERDNLCLTDSECTPLICDSGNFSTLQCLPGDICFCVDALSGQMTSVARRVEAPVTCSEEGSLVLAVIPKCTEQSALRCGTDGRYVPLQINSTGEPFCVYTDTGFPWLANTCVAHTDPRTICERTNSHTCNSKGQYEIANCQQSHSDKYCTNSGYYYPHQCVGKDICFCVDIETGAVRPFTVSQDQNFFCSTEGVVLTATKCLNQTEFVCDSGGWFNPVQSVAGEQVCVFIDSGDRNLHDPNCQPTYDRRTDCERARDERCDGGGHCVQCDLAGLFRPKQCFAEGCYCVDQITGYLGDRPASRNDQFNCTESGGLVMLTNCRNQSQLTCDEEGLFRAEQMDEIGMIFCVYVDSGAPIQGSGNRVECVPQNDTRTHCERTRDDRCFSGLNTLFEDLSKCSLLCDISGLYKTKQCDEAGLCWCVNPLTGDTTPGTAGDGAQFECDATGAIVLLTSCQQQTDLECTKTGDYVIKQCSRDGACRCVYEDTGATLHNTSNIAVDATCPIRRDNRSECQVAWDAASCHPDNTKCVPCTVSGEYAPLHCYSALHCTCINVTTGTPIPRTRGRQGSFMCTRQGERLVMTSCRQQNHFLCDRNGRFEPRQCFKDKDCVCVFTDTGAIITRGEAARASSSCPFLADNRTSCQKQEDTGCQDNESTCSISSCEPNGNYKRMQCEMNSRCHCVDPISGRLTDPRIFRYGTRWCDQEGQSRNITRCKTQEIMTCDSQGNFMSTQCNVAFCFCVYLDTGDILPDTESIFYPGSCPMVRENRTLCQISSYNSCPKFIIPGTSTIRKADECTPISCRADGAFFPMECDNKTGVCWCINIRNGEEIAGTRDIQHTFYCTQRGQQVYYTACQQRHIDVCGIWFNRELNKWIFNNSTCMEYPCSLEDGLYTSKQCTGPELCWCITKKTGELIPGSMGHKCQVTCHSNDTVTITSCEPATRCSKQNQLECDYTGGFYTFQVIDDVGQCVYTDSGMPIPFSENTAEEKCPRVKDNRGNCIVELFSKCERTYDVLRQKYDYKESCLTSLQCLSDERYVSKQCSGEVCWCVDPDTGARLPGTTGLTYQVQCDIAPQKSKCRSQYQLRCDGNYYRETQCFTRFCACVYVDSGKIIAGTMTRGNTHCTRQFDTRGHCQRLKEEACRMYYFDITDSFSTLPGCTFNKKCDKEGNFKKMECQGEICTCIDPRSGELKPETSGAKGTFTCNEFGEKVLVVIREKTKCELEGIEECTEEGWYPTPDCSSGVCYCVYADSGFPIFGTEVSGMLPECEKKFDDRSLCTKHNEIACAHQYTEGRIVIPVDCSDVLECADDGNFAPNQCREDDTCFCVNVTTGGVIPDSFGKKGRYVCDEFGHIEVIPTNPPTVCQAQVVLSCDPVGNFYPRQCNGQVCFCVFVDSGRVIPGSHRTILEFSEMVCGYNLDMRTTCEIHRDEACQPIFNSNTYEFEYPEQCYRSRCKGDGSFRLMQCYSIYTCECVHPSTGLTLPGSRLPVGELSCGYTQCEGSSCSCLDERQFRKGEIADAQSKLCFNDLGPLTCSDKQRNQLKMGSPYTVQCNLQDSHKYQVKQCYRDQSCWCVDPFNGTVISGTFTNEQDSLVCKYDPPCVQRQKKEIERAESYKGFYPVSMYNIVQCDEKGEYYPRQCNIRTKECWCVDKKGVELKGTRALPWVTDVRCVRLNPPDSSQRRPRVTVSCPDNLPEVYCPRNNCRRQQCDAYSRAQCTQYRCSTCSALWYDPQTLTPVSCLYTKFTCYYQGQFYRHGEEFDMGCNLVCYCYQGGLRCRSRCLLQNRPKCPDPVILQDPLDPCCKVYACRDKSFMTQSLGLFDDLTWKRRYRRGVVKHFLSNKH